MTLRILFLGDKDLATTSCHRANALRRLGHVVTHLDPQISIARHLVGLLGKIHYHTGYMLIEQLVDKLLQAELSYEQQFDLCWVDGSELLGPEAINTLHARCTRVVLFNHDDPTGPRNARRFRTLRLAIPFYDVCAVVRPMNVTEFEARGARKVIHVWRNLRRDLPNLPRKVKA